MAKKEETGGKLWFGMAFVLVAGLLIGYFFHSFQVPVAMPSDHMKAIKANSIDAQRAAWIDLADNIRGRLALEGKYNCCLEKPCWYCIQKTPGHGEGAECRCLQDIMNGEHPCGECIGEILEGHGLKDKEIVKLYAKAIAHKVGTQHTDHLKGIIADMYNITVEEQV